VYRGRLAADSSCAVLTLALALAGATVTAPRAGAGDDPVRLWAEYPLDPAADARVHAGAPTTGVTRKVDPGPAPGAAAITPPGDRSGRPVWTLPLAVAAGLALVGMAWVAMLVRAKDARWKAARPPRRRRSRAPVVRHNRDDVRERPQATAASGGIRYRD
jgi:hypothetical protein